MIIFVPNITWIFSERKFIKNAVETVNEEIKSIQMNRDYSELIFT